MAVKSAAQEPVVVADSTAVSVTDSLAVGIEPEEEISVTKFSCLTNDLTARVIAPKRDQNNEVCAIIKIVTKDKSLFFEPDASVLRLERHGVSDKHQSCQQETQRSPLKEIPL